MSNIAYLLLSAMLISQNNNSYVKLIIALKHCSVRDHNAKLQFTLVRQCQRSQLKAITYENAPTLEDCMHTARKVRGLALNYNPQARRKPLRIETAQQVPNNYSAPQKNRQPFWQQPQEFFNCHVLECPENATFRSMINDSRFDYFSLYGEPPRVVELQNYTCLPEVGLFYVETEPRSFLNASKFCANSSRNLGTGTLAHVASAKRTGALASLLESFKLNDDDRHVIHLAYVGLHFNRTHLQHLGFRNGDNESLNCFRYVAWSPGYPKLTGKYFNTSCVALTSHRTWISVKCELKLPFICEMYSTKKETNDFDIGATFAEECRIYLN